MTKKLILKDPFIEQQLNILVIKYRQEISKLDEKLNFMDADQLRDHLIGKDEAIDFIKFCDEHIKRLKKKAVTVALPIKSPCATAWSIIFKNEKVSVMVIISSILTNYERFLRGEREQIRTNQLNKEVTLIKKGIGDVGIYNHMRNLRTLFNAARVKYNDEELGIVRIPHYPFKKYKIGQKRSVKVIKDIIVNSDEVIFIMKLFNKMNWKICARSDRRFDKLFCKQNDPEVLELPLKLI